MMQCYLNKETQPVSPDPSMPALISPHEARTLIRHHIVTNPIEDCSLFNCNGRILAQSIVADRAFPPFDRSMMDGYALCAQELAAGEALNIVGQAAAGSPQMQLPIAEKACIEIMTGAIIPQHADCVVPYESVESMDHKDPYSRASILYPWRLHPPPRQ